MSTSAVSNLLVRAFDWLKARAIRDNELAAMSHADLEFLATDIGCTEADLRQVVPRIGDHSELMDRMLQARGLDPASVRHAFAAVIRDMEVTCARCRESGVCRRELDAGTAGTRSLGFCPNAETIDELLALHG
jgi:hypothetical protein